MTHSQSLLERVARAIASGLGDDFDNAFETKHDWNVSRGERGGRFRDINEPMRGDYLDAARAAISAMLTPTREMAHAGSVALSEGPEEFPSVSARLAWKAMIQAALSEGEP